MAGATVLILSSGVGAEHRVLSVDQEARHTFPLFRLMIGLRDPDRITRDLTALKSKGTEVVQGEGDPGGQPFAQTGTWDSTQTNELDLTLTTSS